MSDRPAPASGQLLDPATALVPAQRGPSPSGQRTSSGQRPADVVPPLPRGPLHPAIPRQWTGPDHETAPSQAGPTWPDQSWPDQAWPGPSWPGQPPAGLDAPMEVPRTHPIRNAVLGLTAFLIMVVVLGGVASTIEVDVPTGSGSATVGAWQDNGGLGRLKALLNDLNAAQDAGQNGDVTGMASACRSLRADTEAAKAYQPIPDPEAQTHWAAALDHLTEGSATCITAIRTRDSGLFAQASGEIGAAPADMSRVVKRLLALNP